MALTSSSGNGLSGLASGIDWTSIVNELLTIERAPETQMKANQTTLQQKNAAYQGIGTQLASLAKDVTTLSDPSFFDSRTTNVSNPGVATAAAGAGAPLGTYSFNVVQLASDAVQQGAATVGTPISQTNNVSTVVLGASNFATPITAGSFTVNGAAVTIASTDTLQGAFDKISAATGGSVTASYDASTDKITLNSAGTITLGASGDTSNFLAAARLSANGSGAVTSATGLGRVNLSKPLSFTDNVSSLTLANAGFSSPVRGGTFTVNGQTVTIATSDSLQSVFDKIKAATGNAVTASYNASTDEISLSSSSPVVLGSATDSSNFLTSAELFNNGTGSVTSASSLGGINLNKTLGSANLSLAVTDGGSGAGQFKINGVAISYNASTDSISSVLQRINDSSAGVTATYDSVNDRFQLTNKSTGDIGFSLQDVTGNFLAATGLPAGTLQRGNNLQYKINNGGTLTNQTNSIDAASSGIAGLSVTATGFGLTQITIGSDTSTISSAISQFVTDYNATQSYITAQITPSTNASGGIAAAPLTGDQDAEEIATNIRHFATTPISGATGLIKSLTDMGIVSNGNNNSINLTTPIILNNALADNLSDVKNLFSNSTTGIATQLNTYLKNVTGSNGVLAQDENNMTKQTTDITNSITALEAKITADGNRLTAEFVAMETAINTINTQKQYLNNYFGSSSSSSNAAPQAASSSNG